MWGWLSIWHASADAKWQWHKEGAHHAGPDRAVFHRGQACLDLKAQPKIRLQHRSWHLFGLVLMFVISLDRKHSFLSTKWCDCWMEIESYFEALSSFFAFVIKIYNHPLSLCVLKNAASKVLAVCFLKFCGWTIDLILLIFLTCDIDPVSCWSVLELRFPQLSCLILYSPGWMHLPNASRQNILTIILKVFSLARVIFSDALEESGCSEPLC